MYTNDAGRRALLVAVARSATVVVAVVVGYFLIPIGSVFDGGAFLRSAVAIALVAGVLVTTTMSVARSERPVLRAIEAVSMSVVVLLTVGASVSLSVSSANPDAYSEPLDHVDALYLSMTTMTTVGFGDIGTVSTGARIATMGIMAANVLVLGVSIRLITRIATDRRASLAEHTDSDPTSS